MYQLCLISFPSRSEYSKKKSFQKNKNSILPTYSVFVKTRQPAKIATYFTFCASYFNKLVHRLYYKAMNLARFMTISAGYPQNFEKSLTCPNFFQIVT